VREAIVLALPASGTRESELGALVAGSGDVSSIRRAAAAILEPVEMPRQWRLVRAIPRLATGKPDRARILALLGREIGQEIGEKGERR
jgi:acyl-coenzyme A synthetase/AMP-(fatty) acid ligase